MTYYIVQRPVTADIEMRSIWIYIFVNLKAKSLHLIFKFFIIWVQILRF
jgi:hypothetical protein